MFTIKAALKTILYQLSICNQKVNGISPFESNFCRRDNTPLSIISSTPKHFHLSYDKIPNHFFKEEGVAFNKLIPEEHCGAYRIDEELERNMFKTTQDGQTREWNEPDNGFRFL